MSPSAPRRAVLLGRVSTDDKGQNPENQLGPLRRCPLGRKPRTAGRRSADWIKIKNFDAATSSSGAGSRIATGRGEFFGDLHEGELVFSGVVDIVGRLADRSDRILEPSGAFPQL
jgi:hypothetical protein